MAVVMAALLPVFLLIALGFVLKRTLIRPETQWHGLERLTYYVLLPLFLIQTLVKADLSTVPVGGVGGPAFTSVFQGATRWQNYVALSVSASMFGNSGLAIASVAMIAIVPMV